MKLLAVLEAPYLARLPEFPANGFDGVREGLIEIPGIFPNRPVVKGSPAYPFDVLSGGAAPNWTLFDQQCQGVLAAGVDLLLTAFYNGIGGDWDSKSTNALGNVANYTSAANAPQSPTDYCSRHPSPKDVPFNVLAVLAKVSRAVNFHGIPASRITVELWNEYQDRIFGGQNAPMAMADGTGAYAGLKVGNYAYGGTKQASTYMQFEVQQLSSAIVRALKANFPAVKVAAPSMTHSPLSMLPAAAASTVGAATWGLSAANVTDLVAGGVADCFGLADYLNLHSYVHANAGQILGIDEETGDASLMTDDLYAKASVLRQGVTAQLEAAIQGADAVPALAGKPWAVSEFGQSFAQYGSKLNRFFVGQLLDEFAQTYELHPRVAMASIYSYVEAGEGYGLIPTAQGLLNIGNGGAFDQGKHYGLYLIRERRRGTAIPTAGYPNSLA